MRMILTFVPAGIEEFFEEVEPVEDRAASQPPPSKELVEGLVTASPRYGIEFQLPRRTDVLQSQNRCRPVRSRAGT